jgi:hypothetical protein
MIQSIAVLSAVLILGLSLMQQQTPALLKTLTAGVETTVANALKKAHATTPVQATPVSHPAAPQVILTPANSLVPPPPAIQ